MDQRIIERTNAIYNIGFVSPMSPQERAQVIDEYRRVLRVFPLWVIEQAFDNASREFQRRPTPGELVVLADRAKRPIADEIARRRKQLEKSDAAHGDQVTDRIGAEDAERLCQAAGFTPKRIDELRRAPMAVSFAEAEVKAYAPSKPDWTQSASQAQLDQLRSERDANPLVQAARADAAATARRIAEGI